MRLRRVSFADLPGWTSDRHSESFAAFGRSARHGLGNPYRAGALGATAAAMEPSFRSAAALDAVDDDGARSFFEANFTPFLIEPEDGSTGFVTGFYEPLAQASTGPDHVYRYPVYRRPPDLLKTPPQAASLDGFAFARRYEDGSVGEYFDRSAIESGVLAGQGLVIAWLKDRVDLFFIHVQGAARLIMGDGSVRRITYDGKSGHPFTGIGSVLADLGEIPREQVTMQSIRAWLARNPARMDEIMWRNRSFIFFREEPVDDAALGPVAAAKVPLTPGRSLAVDKAIHSFGTPFHVEASGLAVSGGRHFSRLMVAQDTGSAITGPARGDIFTGSGDEAGEIAGVIKHEARFHVLLPVGWKG